MRIKTLKELSENKPVILDNVTCAYCGVTLSPRNDTKEHVIGRRFVPKGTLNGQWNLIVRACKACNGKKSDLENDISAITMHPDASGSHVVGDRILELEAKRKAKSISRGTKKPISESSEQINLKVPFGPGVQFTFNLSSPPQIEEKRIYELARMQMMGFFYWITYDHKTKRGGFWPGLFFALLFTPRSDWGNPIYKHFMGTAVRWKPRVLFLGAENFFKASIRRHPDAICWSWALEWNQNYRVIGFFGEEAPVRSVIANFPTLKINKMAQGPNEYVNVLKETPLKENEDCLFEWEGLQA